MVGAGSVDPVAALTWQVSPVDPDTPRSKQIAAPPPPAAESPLPRIIAFAGTGALALVVLATAVIAHRRKDATP
jgi:membrane-anchored mycosin MYCP